MDESLKYMFTISISGCVACLALLILRFITHASLSLFFGIAIGVLIFILFLLYQIFKSEGPLTADENSNKRNIVSISSLIICSTLGIVLARVFADALSQSWENILIGSIGAFCASMSGVVAYILWSHGKTPQTTSSNIFAGQQDHIGSRLDKKIQEEIEWRERLRRQRNEDAEWRKSKRQE